MRDESDLRLILDQLISLKMEGDPSISNLLTAVPDLKELDWINRFGPAFAWERIASSMRTDVLEWVTKVLVIAEREFDWIGGSVAAPIWLFRAYVERSDADADALAEWVLRNRGRNSYVPFGNMTSARSLEGWDAEQRTREENRGVQRFREEEQQRAKIERAKQSIVRSAERREKSQRRYVQFEAHVGQLRELGVRDRLSRIATEVTLPLEVIPAILISECVAVAGSLDQDAKEALLGRIDRRHGPLWKSLRVALVG